ncbi:hypothetical protein Pla8534_67270 [Lignipirellula cremea]|uniref:ISKra4 family transposase n=1 Tax=Lignipirellula cremea TaxID=2528010 RepID=A0A518E3Z4_9BACT|nr:hypothetical protein Pla8534_67270 [Lignipirellula cremea]
MFWTLSSPPTCSASFGKSWPRYNVFSRREIRPAGCFQFERRLERLLRELGRLIFERTLRRLESQRREQTAASFTWNGETYRRNRQTVSSIDTRFGRVNYERWFFQNGQPGSPGVAPLDVRLGIVAGRMTPALAEATGRLAADMPQQAALQMLRERFAVKMSVDSYRRVVAELATEVRGVHDEEAIEQLLDWLRQARQSAGKHSVLLQVGRDGVYVQTCPCWEEAACATLAVYDRNRKRLGTIYLGQMPESEQPTMTRRLTNVIEGVLRGLGDDLPALRYVTDAGCHPQAYYHDLLAKMKHPLTQQPLSWSWGVDFFHACEYVAKLAAAIYGTGKESANHWAEQQRKTLRDDPNGVSKVIARAAQQKRRHGLRGTKKDYALALNYFKRYRDYMDYAARRERGEPIGSGITEAGCKVIFNQRLKQSGMRWRRATGQYIVDLRTANRSRLWPRIWNRLITAARPLPPITQANTNRDPEIN